MRKTTLAATLMAALVCASPATAETYRGITIAPESRCAKQKIYFDPARFRPLAININHEYPAIVVAIKKVLS